MICPKCKTEYREGYIKCSDCGEDLIKNDTTKQDGSGDWFSKFGVTTSKKAISVLFFLGLFPLAFTSFVFGKYLYQYNTYLKDIWLIQDGQRMYTNAQVNNLPLGVFGGFILFIVAALIWKVQCELLIIIFRAIETYTQKNKIQRD